MSFLNQIENKNKITESEHDNYFLETWLYQEMSTVFKAKIWKPKSLLKNKLVKEIWLNESRQLNKLKSVTNAVRYIEVIHDNFIDSGNFCLIYLSSEDIYTLPDFIKDNVKKKESSRLSLTTNYHWLHPRKILELGSRILFWKNILRLIEGIEILHRQGIIHRNINIDCILYNDSEKKEDDERFILGGFEKSLDFNKITHSSILDKNEGMICTTHQDWQDVSCLITTLLNMKELEYNESIISTPEINIIKQLKRGVSQREITKGIASITQIKNSLNNIISNLSNTKESVSSKLYITTGVVNSDDFEKISNKISEHMNTQSSSEYNPTPQDIYGVLEEDLNISPIKVFHNRGNNYLLKGRSYFYSFRRFSHANFPNWNVSYINDIYIEPPEGLNYKDSMEIHSDLHFVKSTYDIDINELVDETSWEIKLLPIKKQKRIDETELNCLQGFLMSLAVDISLVETKKYIINIREVGKELKNKYPYFFSDEKCYYYIFEYQKKNNHINNKLSNTLKLRNTFDRFKRNFSEESHISKWIIEPNREIKDIEKHEVKAVSFVEILDSGEYIFSSEKRLDGGPEFFDKFFRLYPLSLVGDKVQIDRKVEVFKSLLNNTSLILSLSEPEKKSYVSSRKFDVEEITNDFDDSKKEVFEALIKTQPNFFIEGPPGVGKTFLITNYIKHIFIEENNAKVLLSAQAHSTVRILYENTINAIKNLGFFDDLIVISAFKDGDTNEYEHKNITFKTTKPFINKFKESEMFKSNNLDDEIKQKLNEFIERPDRNFFNHILRSANIIFTTSNSELMSSLVKDDIIFDISIMEESAKASGLELLAPMLVSNKRVLIGDYKQLPAFSDNQIDAITKSYGNVDIELLIKQLGSVSLKNSTLHDLGVKRKIIDDAFKIKLLQNLKKYFSLFRSLSKRAEVVRNNDQGSFGGMINIQHRMHPKIAQIVSSTVYDDKLKTHHKKDKHFQDTIPFFFQESELGFLNKVNAIIWVDLPDKQSGESPQYELKYVNHKEIEVIKELLSKITTNLDEKYSIKILSPYSNQVNMLNKQIVKEKIHPCFSESLEHNIASTVDSFQGDEADVIIVSLVRHNSNPDIGSALGFISDMRRMNVLLSRAKYKMIIVGCFSLFKRWHELELQANKYSGGSLTPENFDFLCKFVQLLKSDYETMLDKTTSIDEKTFSNVNFVSAKKFLGIK